MVQKRAHSHGTGLTESEMHELTVDPYEESAKYADGVIIFVCAGIVLCGALRALLAVRARNGRVFTSSTTYRKTAAAARYISSRQQKLHGWYYPTLGIGLLIVAFYAFTMIWTWSVRPYYMSHWYVSSPPLAIRSGMMALGCFPFIFAFATKWNFITFITGHSHEKLQVLHQFMSHIFLVLSFIHTIPFLIQGLAEYRPGTEPPIKQLDYSWNVAKKVYYWTGAGLIAMLGWLCWFSIPWLRHRYYETFKYLHVLCALIFIPFFVLHCNRLLGSWPYLFATCAIYGASVVFRFGWMFWINFSRGVPRASFEVLPAGMIKLRVTLGAKERWSPGQHYFFHFLTVQPFQSHPFTIASNSHSDPNKPQEMVVLVRQASGVTKSLGKYLKDQHEVKKIPLFLDGPFGGVHTDLGIFEHVVLFAGGTGITFIAPLLQDLVRKIVSKGEKTVCKSVHLVWSARESDALDWLLPEIEATVSEAAGAVSVSLHVTGALREDKRSGDAGSSKLEQERESEGHSGTFDPVQGRPAVPSVLQNASREHATLGVAVCGPESLVFDVRNSVADIQKQILLGNTSCNEVFLHSEEYSW